MSRRIPALELPYELISDIFISCLPLRRRVRPHRNRAPLNLASICGQWRSVAITTPQLWTSIYLNFDGKDGYDGIPLLFGFPDAELLAGRTAALMDLWFTRAAGHPLSISLICTQYHSLPNDVLTIIQRYYTQWGRVELAIPIADFLVFNQVAGPFSSLASLSLRITDHLDPFSGVRIHSIHRSPHLRALQLMDKLFRPTMVHDVLVLPQTLEALRVLHSEHKDTVMADFASIIDRLPNLRHFDSSAGWPALLHGDRVPTSLTSFRANSSRILDFFTMPTLQHLHVWFEDASLVPFLLHSQCHLASLTLDVDEHLPIEVFADCLSLVPALDTLVLLLPETDRSRTARFEALQRPDVLPQLRVLIITDSARAPVYERLVAVLRARPALAHAELHMRSWHASVRCNMLPPPTHIEEELAALADRGMAIRVTTQTYAWPWNAEYEDPVGDLDLDVFGPRRQMRPYFFSPF
ncbi:F-box domain-containing protein [Mycena venus]|uniref:F-box domain-containing protein n=1 Tax=Mycena venus TaxID=2733690 RepID=A0A8H6Y850_9AGAR|nr:F-box domain-containing protein [Mycena venus]